MFAKKLFGYII